MKILIIVNSKHRQNTLKIAEAMAEAAPATIVELADIDKVNKHEYDVLGFGSGIYAGKFDKKMIKFVKSLCDRPKPVFVFSTSGSGKYEKYNTDFVNLLESKNKIVLGSFGCKGAFIAGIGKGHPDIDDFTAAQEFIEGVMKKYEELEK